MRERTIEIAFSTAFHHGSGYGLAGVVDRAILRDSGGVPFLAASAIKGKLRYGAVRVLVSGVVTVCQYGDDASICKEEECCPICRLFGSAFRQGVLRFSDAYPAHETGKLLNEIATLPKRGVYSRDASIRFGTGMNRMTGRVKEGLLFSSETLPESLVFAATIFGEIQEQDEDLLGQACRVLTHFGAGGARGLGRCEYRLVTSELGGKR
jgi:CRISPR/Cas system CMR subunit Cmr4 (Cas7 group RAMP superfamily)